MRATLAHGALMGLRRALQRRETVAICALLVAGAAVLTLLVHADDVFLSRIANADILQPVALLWDLGHYAFAGDGFQLSRIPSIVPDLVVYGALDLAFGNFRWALFGYSFLQCAAFVAVCARLTSAVTGARFADAAGVFLLLIAVVLATDLLLSPIVTHYNLFTIVEHFGAFLLSLFGAWLAVSLLDRFVPGRAGLLGLTVFAGFLSNKIFAFEFLIPLAAALVVLVHFGLLKRQRAQFLMLIAGIGVAAAVAVDLVLPRQPDRGFGDPLRFFWQAPTYFASVAVSAIISLVIPLLICIGYVVRGGLAGGLLRIGERPPTDWLRTPAQPFVWMFAAVAVASTTALGIALYEDPQSFRYFIPGFFWPLVLVGMIALSPGTLSARIIRKAVLPASAALMLVLAGLLVLRGGSSALVPKIVTWQDPLGRCLVAQRDALGLRAGLADYWLSRPAMVSTGWSIQVDQITTDGRLYYWGNNRFRYVRALEDPDRPPAYNFIVIDRLEPSRIEALYGAPDRIGRCGGFTLWIYDDSVALHRKLLATAPESLRGDLARPRRFSRPGT